MSRALCASVQNSPPSRGRGSCAGARGAAPRGSRARTRRPGPWAPVPLGCCLPTLGPLPWPHGSPPIPALAAVRGLASPVWSMALGLEEKSQVWQDRTWSPVSFQASGRSVSRANGPSPSNLCPAAHVHRPARPLLLPPAPSTSPAAGAPSPPEPSPIALPSLFPPSSLHAVSSTSTPCRCAGCWEYLVSEGSWPSLAYRLRWETEKNPSP